MADATIDKINPADLDLVTHLYNSMFRPVQDEQWIARRVEGRMKPLVQVARIGSDAVGFYIGFELKPSTHYTWLVGVVPEMRRTGIASQLMHAAEDWSFTEGYKYLRFECDNRIRAFLQFGISYDFDIVGIRWDIERLSNLVIFEKAIEGDSTFRPPPLPIRFRSSPDLPRYYESSFRLYPWHH